MNNLTKPDAPTKTLLSRRYLIPLLVFGYVVLGGFLVSIVTVAVGHLIMAGLAVGAIGVVMVSFYRYDTYYRPLSDQSPSRQRDYFSYLVASILAITAVFMLHVVTFISGNRDVYLMYIGEGMVLGFAATVAFMEADKY